MKTADMERALEIARRRLVTISSYLQSIRSADSTTLTASRNRLRLAIYLRRLDAELSSVRR